MQFYRNLNRLRKSAGLSQEQLAEKAGVSRQTVFKWEAGLASPSMENLLALCRIFGVSADELIGNEPQGEDGDAGAKETEEKPQKETENCVRQIPAPCIFPRFRYEYKSRRTLFGLPLVHINVGQGFCRARGVIAIGNLACGVFSLGLLSAGVFSVGVLSVGLVAAAALALGGLALGAIAVGLMAIGSVAIGVISIGALSVGVYSVGAAAFASEIAATVAPTGYAKAPVVVSGGLPKGSWTTLVTDFDGLLAADTSAPRWILRLLASVL